MFLSKFESAAITTLSAVLAFSLLVFACII